MRYRGVVSYDGTNYSGWQKQPGRISIQGLLEEALFSLTGQHISVTGAGRTDAGVHAYGQVFHFDCDKSFAWFARSLNSQLPADVYVREVTEATPDFHSRYDAVRKHYRYCINCGEYDVFLRNRCYQLGHPLDVEKMREGAALFKGEHDFTSFNATKLAEMANQVRTIYSLDIREEGNLAILDFVGNGFLRHMVRMITGSLIALGLGNTTLEDLEGMLNAADKEACHQNAPAEGLYLVQIDY